MDAIVQFVQFLAWFFAPPTRPWALMTCIALFILLRVGKDSWTASEAYRLEEIRRFRKRQREAGRRRGIR